MALAAGFAEADQGDFRLCQDVPPVIPVVAVGGSHQLTVLVRIGFPTQPALLGGHYHFPCGGEDFAERVFAFDGDVQPIFTGIAVLCGV